MKKANKKLLFVSPQRSSFFIPMTNTLTQMGFDVMHFDYLKPNIFARLIGFATNKLSKVNAFHPQLISFVNRELIKSIKRFAPRYMLVIKGEVLTPETIQKANKLGVITINWFPDNDGLWKLLIKTAPYYQYYFSVCQYLTKKLRENRIPAYYLSVADVADVKMQKATKEYDLVFVGHKTNRRIDYFSSITDLGFDLWGYKHWKQTPLAPYYHNILSVEQAKDIYRQSKIIVNVSTGEEGVPVIIANLRNFEATAVGAFVLSEYNEALAELFIEDKEMVFFRSKSDLRKKAQYYLEHASEREKIAQAGWRKTKTTHTYQSRFKKMFTTVNQDNARKN